LPKEMLAGGLGWRECTVDDDAVSGADTEVGETDDRVALDAVAG